MATLQSQITLNDKSVFIPEGKQRATILQGLAPGQMPNSYTCPLGRGHGTACVMMRKSDLDAIEGQQEYTLKFKAEWENVEETITIPTLYWVQAHKLSVSEPDQDDAPYLLELADGRWLLERWSDSGQLLANVRSAAQSADFLTGTSGSWNDFAGSIWGTMSQLGAYPGGVSSDGVPEGFDVRGENSWQMLNDVLEHLGQAVAYDPINATYSIVTYSSTAQAAPDIYSERLTRDLEPIENNATRAPATIRVYFSRWYKGYGQQEGPEIDNWQTKDAATFVDVPTGITGAVAGTRLALWDDLYATRDKDGVDDNSSERTTRANSRVAAWLADANIDRAQSVHQGFLNGLLPGSRIKSVQWRSTGRGPETMVTAVHGQITARSQRPGRLPSMQEEWKTPDLSRRTFPNWPNLPDLVQVDDGTSSTELIDPNSDELFSGVVARVEGDLAGSGTIQTKSTCWIRFVDEHETNLGDVKARNLDFFYARLSGTADSAASFRPLYVARRGSIGGQSIYGKANENWRKAGDDGSVTLTGTLEAFAASAAIVGTGTAFDTELTPGSTLLIDGTNYNILSITDATNLTLTSNFTGTPAAGYAVQKPALASTPTVPWIRVNPTSDITGTTTDFATTNIVFWAEFNGDTDDNAKDPNVEAGQIISYDTGTDGLFVAKGYYDLKILDVIRTTRTQATDLKQGWRRCDGTANDATNGGSGVNTVCRMSRGHPLDTAAGLERGTETHFHRLNDIATGHEEVEPVVTPGTGIFVRPLDPDADPIEFQCTERHVDSETGCECAGTFSDCDPANPFGEDGFCEVPVEYTTFHDLERIDNSQTFLDSP